MNSEGQHLKPTYGSLFSGAGGFDLGMDRAGFRCVFQVEWDRHCQEILRHNWPHVPKWLDVQEVHGAEIPPCDVLTFGSPCQDLSTAGKRAGLDGAKSSMFFEAVRIAKEMRNATNATYPRIVVWENVGGALSSNKGGDFSAVIDNLAELGAVAIEWAVLDAQHFGIPQRRRRLFAVGILDPAAAGRSPDPLLPVTTGSRRRVTSRGTEKQNNATPIEGSIDTDRWPVAFSDTQGLDLQPSYDAFPTLRREGAEHAVAMAYDEYNETLNEIHHTIRAGTKQSTGAMQDAVLRRLTPVECERLMGWPDDHTRWRSDGTEQAETNRYKMCGNGVAAPVAEWIGAQILPLLET